MQKRSFIFIVFIIIAAFVGIGYFVNVFSNQYAGPPSLSISEEIGHFGQIKADKELTYDFILTNQGGETLVIERVQASCGCTATLLDDEKIEPGQSTRLAVTFNPRGYEGVVTQSVYIYSNDPENPRQRVSVTADIEHLPVPVLHLSNNLWELGLLSQGELSTYSLELSNRGEIVLMIEQIELPEHITYNETSLELPITILPDDKIEIDFSYQSAEIEEGLVREYIRLTTTDPKRKNVTLRVEGYIVEKEEVISIYPIQKFQPKEGNLEEVFEAKYLLKNHTGNQVKISSIQSPKNLLELLEEEITLLPGEEQEIYIQLTREELTIFVNEKERIFLSINIGIPMILNLENI